jgi:hypothetical protein
MRILVFLYVYPVVVNGIIQKIFSFQDGVGKCGRVIEPHWRNKGKGFKYYLPKLECFFFQVMDKAKAEQKRQCHEIFDFRLFS